MARVLVTGKVTNRDEDDNKIYAIPNATITVTDAETANELNLYATEGAGSPSTITTDSDGVYNFWLDILDISKRIKIFAYISGSGAIAIDNYQILLDIEALSEKLAQNKDDILLSEDSEDSFNQKKAKFSNLRKIDMFIPSVWDGNNYGDYMVRRRGGIVSTSYHSFYIPKDVQNIDGIYLVYIPEQTIIGEGLSIYSDYGAVGEAYNNHSESDVTVIIDMTLDQITSVDVSSVYSSLAGGDYCGLSVTWSLGLGNDVNILGILVRVRL